MSEHLPFDEERLDRLQSVLKQRGLIIPAFEIHGGSKGLYDFGPVGGRLRSKIQSRWLHHWLSQGDIVEIACPTVTPYSVLEASGHVDEFTDFMVDCLSCEESSRADSLIEDNIENADALNVEDLGKAFEQFNPPCPDCGQSTWSKIRSQNLMFNTNIGVGKSGKPGFLRPETAQGMFTLFPKLIRHFRDKLPFGAVQIGKGYRNEISPRQGMIRLREFNMAELEYFIDPSVEYEYDFSKWDGYTFSLISETGGEQNISISTALQQGLIRHPTVAYFMARTYDFLISIGIDSAYLRFRQHHISEMAHYAQDCWDVELLGSYGWVECVGIAHRGCYDLEAHEKHTGRQMKARREYIDPVMKEIDGWVPNASTVGPTFRQHTKLVSDYIQTLPLEIQFPHEFKTTDGEILLILEEHVNRDKRVEKVSGEWFTPHVVEPAFGIDRIIWHVLDHNYHEVEKSGELYTYFRFKNTVSPVDFAVLPLFDKDGMDIFAKEIFSNISHRFGMYAIYDGGGSIGKRYARADEIGIPYCLTIDHQSLEDGTFTLRYRDDARQERITKDQLIHILQEFNQNIEPIL